MRFGLTPLQEEWITNNIVTPLQAHSIKVYVFGSRVTNRYKEFSDLDLLIVPDSGAQLPKSLLGNLRSFLEDSDFPYKVDLVLLDELAKSYRDRVISERVNW